MKKEKGQQPWNTANYAGGKLKGIGEMLRKKRPVNEVFYQLLGAKKLFDKLFYQQIGTLFQQQIYNRADRLLDRDTLNQKQRAILENICKTVYKTDYTKLCAMYRQVCRIEKGEM
ncbi:MAG: hypothetical protein AB7G44_09915 [Bacteroidia bacterium]